MSSPTGLAGSPEDDEKGYMAGVGEARGPETPRWYLTLRPRSLAQHSLLQGPHEHTHGRPVSAARRPRPSKSNPSRRHAPPKKIEEALKKLDFYLVMDTHWNSSCDYADYCAPGLHELRVQLPVRHEEHAPPVRLSPLTRRSPSLWARRAPTGSIYLDLAVRMGYGEDFWNGDMDAMPTRAARWIRHHARGAACCQQGYLRGAHRWRKADGADVPRLCRDALCPAFRTVRSNATTCG